ncbi:MAG: hypothetical protein KDD58_01580 [Bdellovibrionales bacterium]|nr:hypothetical protein [Bdellovibrionales bacterium]
MKKMWDKCSTIEKALVVLSSLLFSTAVVSLFYFESIFKKNMVNPEDKIAQVVSVNQEVKRRMPMNFEFGNLKEGDYIGNGDSIFSGDNSQIMVKFLKGSQLIIGEQSLVVLRELNGKMDMKIEKGGVSGALQESDEIEIKAEDESVTINGEKDAQFSVSYKPGLGMEIISYDKNLKVKYRGDEMEMKNKKAIVSDKKGIEIKETTGGKDNLARKTASNEDNYDMPPKMPKGVDVDDVKLKEKQIALSAPFPALNQIFLHAKGGQIPIFPKEQCLEGCELNLLINKKPALKKDFPKNSIPIIHVKIEPNIEAKIQWTFKDGEKITSGAFEVKKNNELNFSKALQNKVPVEVMN